MMLTLLAVAVAAAADAPPPPSAPPAQSVFVRAGAGIGRGELFVGAEHARPSSRVPLSLEIGKTMKDHVAASVSLLVEPGRSEHGISMTRVALGPTLEGRIGPLFAGGGVHAVWFGATRMSRGPAEYGFVEAEPVLWRLGVGAHAMLGIDFHVVPHTGVFTAVRGDVDALVSLGSATVPYGSITGVAGLSFF